MDISNMCELVQTNVDFQYENDQLIESLAQLMLEVDRLKVENIDLKREINTVGEQTNIKVMTAL